MTIEDAVVLEVIADAIFNGELVDGWYKLSPEDAAAVGTDRVHVPSVLKIMADAIRAEVGLSDPGTPLQ